MKQLESAKELEDWSTYRQYMKESLKLVDGEVPAFISKQKLDFSVDGKPWKGHAFLAGKKARQSVQKLKKDGMMFHEGLCTRESKELSLRDFKLPKLIKETEKTFLKLKLGYTVAGGGAADDADAEGAAATDAAQAQAAWKKIKAELGKDVRGAIEADSPDKARITQLATQAGAREKQGDFAGATALFEELRPLLQAKLSPERRKEMLHGLGNLEKDLDRLLNALKP